MYDALEIWRTMLEKLMHYEMSQKAAAVTMCCVTVQPCTQNRDDWSWELAHRAQLSRF